MQAGSALLIVKSFIINNIFSDFEEKKRQRLQNCVKVTPWYVASSLCWGGGLDFAKMDHKGEYQKVYKIGRESKKEESYKIRGMGIFERGKISLWKIIKRKSIKKKNNFSKFWEDITSLNLLINSNLYKTPGFPHDIN